MVVWIREFATAAHNESESAAMAEINFMNPPKDLWAERCNKKGTPWLPSKKIRNYLGPFDSLR
jgi:hypothetical protein